MTKLKLERFRLDSHLSERLANLHSVAHELFEADHYIESVIITFQLVDFQLGLLVMVLAKRRGLRQPTIRKMLEEEDQFPCLVSYFELLKPGSDLSARLRKLNIGRNRFVPKLFFTSKFLDNTMKILKNLCLEAQDLAISLAKLAEEDERAL